jgi:hypothetical protein
MYLPYGQPRRLNMITCSFLGVLKLYIRGYTNEEISPIMLYKLRRTNRIPMTLLKSNDDLFLPP